MKKYRHFYNIIKGQYSTEKTVFLTDKYNSITFEVDKKSNKYEIKNAIEKLFNIKVKNIKTLNIKGKNIKFKNHTGKQKNWKKAIVVIKEGFNINFSEFK